MSIGSLRLKFILSKYVANNDRRQAIQKTLFTDDGSINNASRINFATLWPYFEMFSIA